MKPQVITHVRAVVDGHRMMERARVTVEAGKILTVEPDEGPAPEYALDGGGLTLTPGLIDLHIHGAAGRDLIEGSQRAARAVSENISRDGVTAFMAALTVVSHGEMLRILKGYGEMAALPGARLAGVHAEGPYLSRRYKALMDERWLRDPSVAELDEMLEASAGRLRVMTVAPELPGMDAFIRQAAQRGVAVMLGHTAASSGDMHRAALAGARGITHLYNAMSQHLHREPGAVTGAFLEEGLYAELIADGYHVAPDVVRMTYRYMGPERLILITDAMLGKGMPDGDFVFSGLACRKSGLEVKVIDGGRRAGSAIGLNEALRRMQQMTGCGPCQLVQMACVNPARVAGLEGKKGRLMAGMDADLALFDDDWVCKGAMAGGKWIWRADG